MNDQQDIATPERLRAWDAPLEPQGRPRKIEAGSPRRTVAMLGLVALTGVALVSVLAVNSSAWFGGDDAATAESARIENVRDDAPAEVPGDAEASVTASADGEAGKVPSDDGAAQAREREAAPADEEADGPGTQGDGISGTSSTAAAPPGPDDARWAGAFGQADDAPSGRAEELRSALAGIGGGEEEVDGHDAMMSAFSGLARSDGMETASIDTTAPSDDAFDVAVAESESEVAALEEEQARDNAAFIASLGDEGVNDVVEGALRPARVTEYVNLREGPDNDATVLTVVPANASVEASQECPLQWCEVAFDGTSGYIFEGYVQHAAQ